MVLIIASTRGNGLHTPYQINQRYTYFNLHANSMTYAESLKCKKNSKIYISERVGKQFIF